MIWLCAKKDLLRLRRDPAALLLWIGFPLMLISIMAALFGKESPKPRGLLLIADEDATFVSGALANVYSQGKLGEMIRTEKVKQDEGRARMEKGDASALLVIPKGFSDAFLNNQPMQLPLITNPAYRIMPRLIEETLSVVFDAGFYLQRIAGDEMRAVSIAGPRSEEQVVDLSRRFKRIADSLSKYTNPLLIELKSTVVKEDEQPRKSFGAIFFPSMLFLSLLFIAQGVAMDMWKERTQGAIRRFVSTASPLRAWLGGKMLSAGIVFLTVSSAGFLMAHFFIDLSLDHALPSILWVSASGIGLCLLFMLLIVHAPSERGAGIVANLVTFPLMMAGGSFFPFDLMPANLAAIGRMTPNGFALTKLQEIMDGKIHLLALAPVLIGLIAFCLIVSLIIERRVRRNFAV